MSRHAVIMCSSSYDPSSMEGEGDGKISSNDKGHYKNQPITLS